MRVVVIGVHKTEAILLVEWYGIQVGINSQEPAPSLILDNKHRLDDIPSPQLNFSTE